MKKNRFALFLLVLSPILAIAQGTKNGATFSLTGTVTGQDTGSVVLTYVNAPGNKISDTCRLKKGRFRFSGKVKEPTLAFLSGKIKSRSIDDPNQTRVILEPGTMHGSLVMDDFRHAVFSGSQTQDELSQLNNRKDSVYIEMNEKKFSDEYGIAVTNLNKNRENEMLKEAARVAFDRMDPYKKLVNKIDEDFITSHPKSYLSAYLLRYHFARIAADSLTTLYNGFSYPVQNSAFGNLVKDQIIKKSGAGEGSMAKDFTATTLSGERMNLFSVTPSKVVLLDFWASWCIPCRKGNPRMMALYNKYHIKGLELVCISSDHEKDDWKNAVAKDQTQLWLHVIDDEGNSATSQKNIGKLYAIGVLPTKLMIDRTGKIVYRSDGEEDPMLEKKLAEIFGF